MGNVQSTPMLRILLRKSRFKTQGRFSFLLPWLVISSFVQFSEEDFGSLTVCAYVCLSWCVYLKNHSEIWYFAVTVFIFFEDLTGASLKMKPCYSSFQKEYLFSLLLCQANHVWDFLTPYIFFFRNAYTPILRGCHGCRVWNSEIISELEGEKSKCSVMGLASLRKCPGYRPDPFFLVVVQNPHVQVIIYEVWRW